MRHQINRYPCLDQILEEHPCVDVVHVVPFRQHGDQLIAEHVGNDDPGDRHHHGIRQAVDQAVNIAIPSLRRLAHLSGDCSHLRIHVLVHR